MKSWIEKRGLQKRMVIASVAFLLYSIGLFIYPDWFGDNRQFSGAVACSVCVFLICMSWVLLSRTFISCILIGFFLSLPGSEVQAQTAPPDKDNIVPIFCACVVLGGGILIYLGLRKLCKKLPPLEDYQHPDAPAPPIQPAPPWTNITVWPGGSRPTCDAGLVMNDAAVSYNSITVPMPPDTNGAFASPWIRWSTAQVQSSADLSNWTETVTYTNWWSLAGVAAVWCTNGVPFCTNYSPAVQGSAVNQTPVPLALPQERQRFYRLVSH